MNPMETSCYIVEHEPDSGLRFLGDFIRKTTWFYALPFLPWFLLLTLQL